MVNKMTYDIIEAIKDHITDCSLNAEDACFGIEVDDVDVQYSNSGMGNTCEIGFDVDAHVANVDGMDVDEFVMIAKDDIPVLVQRIVDSVEHSESEGMVPLSVVEEVLDQYRIMGNDFGDLLKEKQLAHVIMEISDEAERQNGGE